MVVVIVDTPRHRVQSYLQSELGQNHREPLSGVDRVGRNPAQGPQAEDPDLCLRQQSLLGPRAGDSSDVSGNVGSVDENPTDTENLVLPPRILLS